MQQLLPHRNDSGSASKKVSPVDYGAPLTVQIAKTRNVRDVTQLPPMLFHILFH
jgi:hypothetical protein